MYIIPTIIIPVSPRCQNCNTNNIVTSDFGAWGKQHETRSKADIVIHDVKIITTNNNNNGPYVIEEI